LVVFCYHQVVHAPDAFRPGEPTAEEFAKDVETLGSIFTLLPFGEAVRLLASKSLPERAACITFDDGYENNHSLAAPILEEAGVPATFFVAGGAIDDGVMWNDLVIEAIVSSGGSPKIDDTLSFLELPAVGSSNAECVSTLLIQLKYRSMAERWGAARRLFIDNVSSELPRLMMSREQVADLAARGFEVGGHTINHPILKELSDADASEEIQACSEWVRGVTGSTPKTFAYPNGKTGIDFDARHVKMVEDAGFSGAASTDWALAKENTNPLSVPRIGPWWRQGRGVESGLLRSYLRSYL
jgi:peptidoglycan/xylan/chitin deacetylase (PgdA/CDA1 family)